VPQASGVVTVQTDAEWRAMPFSAPPDRGHDAYAGPPWNLSSQPSWRESAGYWRHLAAPVENDIGGRHECHRRRDVALWDIAA